MQSDDATAGVSRFTWRKRYIVVGICLFLLSGGVWFWFGSRKLTSQEQAFVGRWQVTAPGQLNSLPPYIAVWEIKPDRTMQILIEHKGPGGCVKRFDFNWKVRDNQLEIESDPPRKMRDYFREFQVFIHLAQVPSRHILYDVKSSMAFQHAISIPQTFNPMTNRVLDLVRLSE